MRRCPLLLAILLTPSLAGAADDLFESRPGRASEIRDITPLASLYQPELPPENSPTTELAKPLDSVSDQAAKPFGAASTQYFTYGAGFAYNFAEANDLNLRIAWSYFIVDDVEFSAELNAWYFNQPGDDALGINPAFVFRWHAYNDGDWTIFTDAGIGLLFSTDDVPQGGTSFNFTPRVGGGFTYRIGDDQTRLQVGLRWHHISNARIRGDSDNPARDAVMLYAGIMVPF